MTMDRFLVFRTFSGKMREIPPRGDGGRRGQATTEFVLLLPLFVIFLVAFAKVFAVLVLVQKMEIASYYAARRWQLESHRNVTYHSAAYDGGEGCSGGLCGDIKNKVNDYLFNNDPKKKAYLGIDEVKIDIQRTQVWNIMTLEVRMKPIDIYVKKIELNPFRVTKYVPNRDRPIQFVLPGLN